MTDAPNGTRRGKVGPMPHRLVRLVVGLIALCAIAVPAVASAASSSAKQTIVDKSKFKVNRYVQDGNRFQNDSVSVKSGGKLTITNKSRTEHTISLVAKKDLPKTFAGMDACYSPDGACSKITVAHGVDPNAPPEGPPPITLVNVGEQGFDQAGDSQFVAPKQKVTETVSAKKGSTLYALCIIHPWMQFKIKVG
jgi:plastocyanin